MTMVIGSLIKAGTSTSVNNLYNQNGIECVSSVIKIAAEIRIQANLLHSLSHECPWRSHDFSLKL